MTSAQSQIIARLSRNEGIRQAGLAALLDIEPMTLCRHIDRMVAADLVERRQDPKDRRARQLFTTETARALLDPMRKRAAVVFEEAQRGLSEEERQALMACLETLVRNLSDSDAGEPPPGATSKARFKNSGKAERHTMAAEKETIR
nr:MarR family winged helix-turn-helix transcriptional regulator [Jiella sp. LLJ827]